MSMKDDILKQNQNTWNAAAKYFYGGGALPIWGALSEEVNNPGLIGPIQGKVFLEIACGSGHSLDYLIKNGAEKVYGIDFSETQIHFAEELNKDSIKKGNVVLFHSRMEDQVAIAPNTVDTIFSIYGIGWTHDLEATFAHIFEYLKPGGMLMFSFENPLFTRSTFHKETNSFELDGSPYEDYTRELTEWFGGTALVTCRTPETWIRSARNAGFELGDYFEPKPVQYSTEDPELRLYYDWDKVQKISPTLIFKFKKPL
jgi:SAM-dependent methyltransferase